jgi:hypothetical protein
MGDPFWRISIPRSPIDFSRSTSDMDESWRVVLSKSIPSKRPIASFANTTVFKEDRTKRGTGRYCNAVREAIVVVGVGNRIESESELRMDDGDLDRGRSPRSKYPPSTSVPFDSVITRKTVERDLEAYDWSNASACLGATESKDYPDDGACRRLRRASPLLTLPARMQRRAELDHGGLRL